ncbi:MAG: hypothetical protein Fur0018_20790 [Anaerolineales bacterium]
MSIEFLVPLLYLSIQAALAAALHAAVPALSLTSLLGAAGTGIFCAWMCAAGVRPQRRAALLLAVVTLGSAAALSAQPDPAAPLGFTLSPLPFAWRLALDAWSALAVWGMRRSGWTWLPVIGSWGWMAGVNAATSADMTTLAIGLAAGGLTIFAGQHIGRERAWEQSGTDYPTDLRLDTLLVALGLSGTLLTLALLLSLPAPRPVWRALTPLSDALRARVQPVNRALGLRALAPAPEEAGGWQTAGGLPRQHLLDSGPELAQTIVVRVQVQAELPLTPYWRTLTYDTYTGHGWQWSGAQTRPWLPAAPQPVTDAPLLWQEVQHAAGEAPALAFGEVHFLDRPAEQHLHPPDTPFAWLVDARRYRVWSAPPLASPADLRAAPNDIPAWLALRYTQLPPETPPRVRALALELTRRAATPYDKAAALEAYLRTFPYTLDLPAPPADRDVAAYFLFELRRGYCDYHATAFAALGRAAGLPVRLAVGYLGGDYDPQTRTYTLHADDAHSWPEVYFPGYGWIPFEPTAGRPALQRPEAPLILPPAPAPSAAAPLFLTMRIAWGKIGWGGGALALILTGWGVWGFFQQMAAWRLRRRAPQEGILALWARAAQWATRGTDALSAGATPLETARHLKGRLAVLARLPWGTRQLPGVVRDLDFLVEQVNLAWFGVHPPTSAHPTWLVWRRLRWFFLLARLISWRESH